MVFTKEHKNKSKQTEGKATNEIGMNVVIDDGVYQGTCDISQIKQEQSELDSIIMEGDIILKVHADGEIDYSSQKDFQALTGECAGHEVLYEHQDDMLVKVGDTFDSNKDFVNYVNDHATRWCFSYKCTEAQNADTENETYTYCCVYLKNRDYAKKKVVKKRNNSKTDCPCKVKLRRRPGENLTVEYVCNHHDHELSEEDYLKFQSNKKLPPYIKEMIIDLLALDVEISKIRKFIQMETGMKLGRSYITEIEKKMRLKNEERQITDKRLKELSDKMSVVDEMFSGDEDENSDDNSQPKSKRVKLSGLGGGIVCKFEEDGTADKSELGSMNSEAQSSFWGNDQSSAKVKRTSTSEWEDTTAASADDKTRDYAETADDFTPEYTVEVEPEANDNAENTTENSLPQYETLVLQDEFGNIINCENDEQIVILQQDENGMVQGENGTIGYFDGEQIIYIPDPNQQNDQTEQVESNEGNESSTACETMQTSSNANKPGHSVVPVFDVYMKNGNVTGFVVNDSAKDSPDWKGAGKGVRELKDPGQNTEHSEMDGPESQANTIAPNATQEFVTGDIYTKHEYIHRYNIDQYMANPQFPKYIDTLAKKTRVDVMQMLAKVYSEKAMFKMTTTQKGKEGNTKIWYLTDVRRKGKYKMSDEEKMKRDKIGQYITDILILKERCKHLKRENEELITRNKYLEEVALRLAKMHEHN